MAKLIDYVCPECGCVREEFDDIDHVWCISEQCDNNDIGMVPRPWKSNAHRVRINDVKPMKL